MEGVIFFNGQKVLKEDLEVLQSSLEDQLKNRTANIFSQGIINAYGSYVVTGGSANTIKVKALVAYNSDGNRIPILVDLDNLAPIPATGVLSSSGGSWTNSIRYVIVARYAEIQDTSIPHPITSALNNTRKHDSYTLVALRRSGATIDLIVVSDVKLCRVDVSGVGALTITCNSLDVDESFLLTDYLRLDSFNTKIDVTGSSARPSTYAIGETKTLKDHINAVGNGTVSPTDPHGIALSDLSGQITSAQIASNAVIAGKIAADAVTETTILNNAVTSSKIASDAITTTKIIDDAVTTPKILDEAITLNKLAIAVRPGIKSYGFLFQGSAGEYVKVAQRLIEGTITLTKILMSVDTAPAGADLIIDINKNGTTIFTSQANRPKITAGSTSSSTTTIDLPVFSEGDKLSIDIDQVGSGTPGGDDLLLSIIYE